MGAQLEASELRERRGLGETNLANSAITTTRDQRALVELDPDHPGFRDMDYRARRNEIAQIALDYTPGAEVPDAPYTEAEHGVWREVNAHLDPLFASHVCSPLLEARERLGLSMERLPQLREVSRRLEALSGFRLEPAGGLVDPKVFLSALGEGIFLSTQYIRHHGTPLYTCEPDVVHELIGHATLLADPKMAELNRWVGAAARRTTCDKALERLGRIYWYTIEFGVLREAGEIKAYGAGLLSSAGELAGIRDVELRPFDFDAIEYQDFDVTQYQPFLFCADSFDDMFLRMKYRLKNWSDTPALCFCRPR